MGKKVRLSEQELQACRQVTVLRKALGLSKAQFCRQLGCTMRTLGRWEKEVFCPQKRYMVRLRDLQTLNDNADAALREEYLKSVKQRKRSTKLQWQNVRNIQGAIAVLLMRQAGAEGFDGALRFTSAQLDREKLARVQVRRDPQTSDYLVWVKTKKKPRAAKTSVVEIVEQRMNQSLEAIKNGKPDPFRGPGITYGEAIKEREDARL